MAINSYGTATSGNPTNVHAVLELLDSADAVLVTDKFVKTIPVPMNKNETVSLLRAVTPDVDTSESGEGTNKAARSLVYEQVTKTFEEFEESFAVTSRQAELGEYNVLMDSKDRLMDLLKRTREQNAWEEYRGANNVLFNSSAHTLITQVNGALTGGRLEVISRALSDNRAPYIYEASSGSPNAGTTPIEASYIAFGHTDLKPDIRRLPGVTIYHQVGGAKKAEPRRAAAVRVLERHLLRAVARVQAPPCWRCRDWQHRHEVGGRRERRHLRPRGVRSRSAGQVQPQGQQVEGRHGRDRTERAQRCGQVRPDQQAPHRRRSLVGCAGDPRSEPRVRPAGRRHRQPDLSLTA